MMRVLICPLDWGLGHTARMVPVAAELLADGHHVTIGGSERQLAMFRTDLPAVETICFPGFTTRYSRFIPFFLLALIRMPRFVFAVITEHKKLKSLIREGGYDLIISDNRPGLWNNEVKTIYYTHMLRIPLPRYLRFLEPVGIWLHRREIERFDECRIPDVEGAGNLSGRLSHNLRLPSNAIYAGILSKFTHCKPDEMELPDWLHFLHEERWHLLILSGPEPYRSLLRQQVTDNHETENSGSYLVILEGNPGGTQHIDHQRRIVSVPHLAPAPMAALMRGSSQITARSGYTTIMELASLNLLNSNITLIPTPGQTEQIYLSCLHSC